LFIICKTLTQPFVEKVPLKIKIQIGAAIEDLRNPEDMSFKVEIYLQEPKQVEVSL
jgi:hypothetical protein